MPGMRMALAWVVGTALFALGRVLADRWFAAILATVSFRKRPS
jgi:hypothetical protein